MAKQVEIPQRGQDIMPWAQDVTKSLLRGRQAYASQFSNGVAPEPLTTSYRIDNHFTVFAPRPTTLGTPIDTLSVRGGKWVFPSGTEAPLYDGATEKSLWTDVVSVSISTETDDIRIYVVLDADNLKCRIIKSTTYVDTASTLDYIPIATVPVLAGVLGGQILQHWRGGYITAGTSDGGDEETPELVYEHEDDTYDTCQPRTFAGRYWRLVHVGKAGDAFDGHVVPVGKTQYFMQQFCLPLYDVAGYCPLTSEGSDTLGFTDSNGDYHDETSTDGVLGTFTGTMDGVNPSTGEQATVTFTSGVPSGYDGMIEITNGTTGEAQLLRIFENKVRS